MFNFDKFRDGVVAAVAALVLTSTAIGAAVGPAGAVETAPVVYAQAPAAATHA
jgi:hypothetical protein